MISQNGLENAGSEQRLKGWRSWRSYTGSLVTPGYLAPWRWLPATTPGITVVCLSEVPSVVCVPPKSGNRRGKVSTFPNQVVYLVSRDSIWAAMSGKVGLALHCVSPAFLQNWLTGQMSLSISSVAESPSSHHQLQGPGEGNAGVTIEKGLL